MVIVLLMILTRFFIFNKTRLCSKNKNSIEERALAIFLALSHFVHVINIHTQQAHLIREHLSRRSIILPDMDTDLINCLESENMLLKSYMKWIKETKKNLF